MIIVPKNKSAIADITLDISAPVSEPGIPDQEKMIEYAINKINIILKPPIIWPIDPRSIGKTVPKKSLTDPIIIKINLLK